MSQCKKPADATHYNTETGFYAKAEPNQVMWWSHGVEKGQLVRMWRPSGQDAVHLEWDFTYEELPKR